MLLWELVFLYILCFIQINGAAQLESESLEQCSVQSTYRAANYTLYKKGKAGPLNDLY